MRRHDYRAKSRLEIHHSGNPETQPRAHPQPVVPPVPRPRVAIPGPATRSLDRAAWIPPPPHARSSPKRSPRRTCPDERATEWRPQARDTGRRRPQTPSARSGTESYLPRAQRTRPAATHPRRTRFHTPDQGRALITPPRPPTTGNSLPGPSPLHAQAAPRKRASRPVQEEAPYRPSGVNHNLPTVSDSLVPPIGSNRPHPESPAHCRSAGCKTRSPAPPSRVRISRTSRGSDQHYTRQKTRSAAADRTDRA